MYLQPISKFPSLIATVGSATDKDSNWGSSGESSRQLATSVNSLLEDEMNFSSTLALHRKESHHFSSSETIGITVDDTFAQNSSWSKKLMEVGKTFLRKSQSLQCCWRSSSSSSVLDETFDDRKATLVKSRPKSYPSSISTAGLVVLPQMDNFSFSSDVKIAIVDDEETLKSPEMSLTSKVLLQSLEEESQSSTVGLRLSTYRQFYSYSRSQITVTH